MTSLVCDEELDGVTLRQLLALQPTAGPEAPVWLPDGSGILIRSTGSAGAAIRRVDLASGEVTTVATDLGGLPFLSASLFSVSPDGRWLAYLADRGTADGRDRSSRVEIWLQSLTGAPATQLTHLDANINAYQWAPDSSGVVLSANRFGQYDIFKVAVPSGKATRLTKDPRYEVYPTFSLDGEKIYFVRLDERWVDHEIVEMSASGDDACVIVRDEDFFDYHYGRRLAIRWYRKALTR
ncbi:MAG: hypothetical protein HC802_03410 [Caldilineaceae bacterium]|nr:hypothetical protein [Caldilineaceae bacterium]